MSVSPLEVTVADTAALLATAAEAAALVATLEGDDLLLVRAALIESSMGTPKGVVRALLGAFEEVVGCGDPGRAVASVLARLATALEEV